MDQKSQEFLDKILKKDPNELNLTERGFLKARRGYLKESQLLEYKNVIEDEERKVVSYEDLLKRAKELGYKGGRLRRAELNKFIEDHS